MTTFIKNGSIVHIDDDKQGVRLKFLEPNVFLVKYNGLTNHFFLEEIESFTLPSKIYGNVTSRSTRIVNSFEQRSGTTGVLLAGQKGSGKTLLAKQVCIDCQEKGYPIIIVNQGFSGDTFSTFLQSIKHPCVVFIDEFEKVYNEKHRQEGLLTLLDGVFKTQKLFLLTCNEMDRLNDYLINRPGRLYYAIEFDGLSESFVKEYSEDNLKNKEHVKDILSIFAMFSDFNFDMLQTIVEESNRYGESPMEYIDIINIKPQYQDAYYTAYIEIDGKKKEVSYGYDNPATQEHIEVFTYPTNNEGREYFVFNKQNFFGVVEGKFIFNKVIDGKDTKLVISIKKYKRHKYF